MSKTIPLQTATRLPRSPYTTFTLTSSGQSPLSWHLSTSASFPAALCLATSLALLAPLLLWAARRIRMQREYPPTPFRFMDLPPELRDMVYEHLLEDPQYPCPPSCTKPASSPLSCLLPGSPDRPVSKTSNWILLANKQTHAEYMDILIKKAVFHLTVSPANCPKPTDALPPTSPKDPSPKKIWPISPSLLKNIRKCNLNLITTSSMLGVQDPRNMPPASWQLAAQIKSELQPMSSAQETNLHIKAIGDPLWNPLWVWYHASQAFCSPPEPSTAPSLKLGKISFSLDTWSPGENHLARSSSCSSGGAVANERWAWFCARGHCVSPTNNDAMTVRDFCAKLYKECRICRPELESDDEAEDEEEGLGWVDLVDGADE